MTGPSRAQFTRLIAQHKRTGHIRDRRGKPPANPFQRRYTPGDAALPAEVDVAYGRLSGPATKEALRRQSVLALLGFCAIAALSARRIPGAAILGMLGVTALGLILGVSEWQGFASPPPDPTPTLLALDIGAALQLGMVAVIFTFLIVDLFDTAGTLIGSRTRPTSSMRRGGCRASSGPSWQTRPEPWRGRCSAPRRSPATSRAPRG